MATILQSLFGAASSAANPVLATLDGLVPAGLPSHLASLDAARQYRRALSGLEDEAGTAPALAACRQAGALADDLIFRLSTLEHAKSAQAAAAAAEQATDKALTAARKHREQCVKARDAAAAALAETDARLQALQSARQSHLAQGRAAVDKAAQRLRAAVEAGDVAQEQAAAAELREAQQAAETAPALVDLDARHAVLRELHAKRQAAADAAAKDLVDAERAEFEAEQAAAAVKMDAAASLFGAAMVGAARAAVGAAAAGHNLVGGGMPRQVLHVGHFARVWFAPGGSDQKAGALAVSDVVWRVAKALETPFDASALPANPRDLVTQAVAA